MCNYCIIVRLRVTHVVSDYTTHMPTCVPTILFLSVLLSIAVFLVGRALCIQAQ